MPPALHTSKGVGMPPKLPLQPDPWTHPYPQLIQGARSPPWERARALLACSCSHLLQQRLGPRPCLDFSAGLWSISIDWGRCCSKRARSCPCPCTATPAGRSSGSPCTLWPAWRRKQAADGALDSRGPVGVQHLRRCGRGRSWGGGSAGRWGATSSLSLAGSQARSRNTVLPPPSRAGDGLRLPPIFWRVRGGLCGGVVHSSFTYA